ncbi:MAG: MBL fold metallo-hydrolase [Porticoccaceae bacterium]|nr:MBL fold metallo-hydrolase [Porticoccaceae bacterium]
MRLRFWGATGEVTGSCFLIEVGGRRLLVDCGMYQGGRKSEARNAEPFPFEPATIDAVVLTHAHIDHGGRLPRLVEQGFRGPIYTHGAGKELARILLKDSASLAEKDAEATNRKRARKHLPPVAPLYGLADVGRALRQMRGLAYDGVREILPGVRLRLRDAGHILGSSILELWLQDGGRERKLVFSGDLGHRGSLISPDPSPVEEADLVVMESTYGSRDHRSWASTWAELEEIFATANRLRGNILIPAFAVGRTQQLLYILRQKYRDWGLDRWLLALDSPMAIATTRLYARHARLLTPNGRSLTAEDFSPPGLVLSQTTQQSMKLNRLDGGALIIAGSGMCTGGRILHHFKHNLWRRNCQVVMVGYQAEGSLGHALIQGAREVRLWGERVKVAAHIHTVGGLSAHADQSGLLAWYRGFRDRPPVALVHGEPEAMGALEARLAPLARQVFRPAFGDGLDLDTLRVERS